MLTSPHPFQIGLFASTVATFVAMSYPSLQQDPNVVTQSLLAQISQQLSSTNSNGSISPATLSIQNFSPSASVVFVNSVWFLSLVLSLTCALMATLLQQWARRYLQIVRQNHPPHIRAHIREYFYQGARRFRIFGLVELLPTLLIVAVLLFFAGLVVFAFLANHTVAYTTLAIVGFCFLSYIALTLIPLVFHDSPYCTPLTSALWFASQILELFVASVLHRGARQLYRRWGAVSERTVNLFHRLYESKAKSWSEDMIFDLVNSAKHISMDRYTETLTWTLNQLDKDHELMEFVSGIPGLYESEIFFSLDDINGPRNIRPVLAVLPGPKSFDAPLPWSIIWLAKRAIASDLPKPIQQKRTRACLKALYYIPGAIHDLLASFAARKHYCLEILPLLNSPESLEIIEELWDSPNDDVALSVRCAAAVVAAFIMSPPRRTLDNFMASSIYGFIGDDSTGKQFLAKRLRVGPTADGCVAPEIHPHSDTARLQNIVRFLAEIADTLFYMNTQSWTSNFAGSIRQQRQELFEARRTREYLDSVYGRFEQPGNRSSSAFMPAAQQDLIIITLDILARDSVANAATSQRNAFDEVCTRLGEEARAQVRRQMPYVVLDAREILEEVALSGVQAADSIGMVKHALEPVFRSLSQSQHTTPYGYPLQMPMPQIVTPAPAQTLSTNDMPALAQPRSTQRSQPPPIQAPPYMFQYSLPSAAGLATAAADLRNSPVWGSQDPVVE